MKFAIVVSEFNPNITAKLLQGARNTLASHLNKIDVYTFHVPGAIEIPLIAQQLAKTKKYQAIICLGAVIRGETSHFDYVCYQVAEGCLKVMLHFEMPIIFGILTTDSIKQAEDRVGGEQGHKGCEAAETAIKMALLMEKISYQVF